MSLRNAGELTIAALLHVLVSIAFIAPSSSAQVADAGLSGKLVSIGSDTLGTLTSVWAELLTLQNPRVIAQVRAVGSGAAPTALIQGTADVGPMSRTMSPQERRAFVRRYGYNPTALRIAEDALAVFVHRDNPLDTIRLDQLDAVFSVTRRCGQDRPIRNWAALNLGGDWGDRPISVYGRSTASGTYSFFREVVLCRGDFAPHMNRLVGSSAVVRAVAGDREGIGFASEGYINENVKQLQVVDSQGVEKVSLSRGLFLYINRAPATELEPVVAAFLSIALSDAGQREVAKAGYTPLSMAALQRQRERLGL